MCDTAAQADGLLVEVVTACQGQRQRKAVVLATQLPIFLVAQAMYHAPHMPLHPT